VGSVSDRNKRTVEAFYQAEIDRDLATWSNLWHPNGSLSFWLNEMKETIQGRDTLVELEAEKFNRFTEFAFSMEVAADPLEDDSMVLARLRIRPESAPASAFHYWLLFHFDDEGLIVGLEEIADTRPPAGVQL
jgi:ketosteroid isomerase-like protein